MTATTPPPTHTLIIIPKTSSQNFEKASLVIGVEGSGNYVFEEDSPATIALRDRAVSYTPGAHTVLRESVVVCTSVLRSLRSYILVLRRGLIGLVI